MKTVATPPAPRRAGSAGSVRPAAAATEVACVADSAGGLTFDLAERAGPGGAHLLLCRRGSEEEVRLPLTPAGEGRLRAALPSSVSLPEGRWDVFAEPAGGEPVRLLPGLNDLRSLVDRDPEGAVRVGVRIPYATKFGNLSVRSWQRAPHAEADAIHVGPAETTVRGRLYGAELDARAHGEARGGKDGRVLRLTRLTGSGREFRLALPHADFSAHGPGEWALWLRPTGAAGPEVRLSRLLDDIHDRRTICAYPPGESGGYRTGPHYTKDNDLWLRVQEVPAR